MAFQIEPFQIKAEDYKKDLPKPSEEDKPKGGWKRTAKELTALKMMSAIARGYVWGVRLLDLETDKVVFTAPQLCKTVHHAHRKGEQYIKRHKKTGDFNKPTGALKVAVAEGAKAK